MAGSTVEEPLLLPVVGLVLRADGIVRTQASHLDGHPQVVIEAAPDLDEAA